MTKKYPADNICRAPSTSKMSEGKGRGETGGRTYGET